MTTSVRRPGRQPRSTSSPPSVTSAMVATTVVRSRLTSHRLRANSTSQASDPCGWTCPAANVQPSAPTLGRSAASSAVKAASTIVASWAERVGLPLIPVTRRIGDDGFQVMARKSFWPRRCVTLGLRSWNTKQWPIREQAMPSCSHASTTRGRSRCSTADTCRRCCGLPRGVARRQRRRPSSSRWSSWRCARRRTATTHIEERRAHGWSASRCTVSRTSTAGGCAQTRRSGGSAAWPGWMPTSMPKSRRASMLSGCTRSCSEHWPGFRRETATCSSWWIARG